ncbi:MAG: tRNA (guanosine(37)-N1)-methyltransferase TrmD [Spirochaetaceae bacterium]|nr:MAG: tRNA (guanosine(37)-N1)-methyltransferase TrmD [Spirochaetaceae bacterium]
MDSGYGITVLTLFPELVREYFRTSLVGKAAERGALHLEAVDIRSFARDRHRTCDDAPYGGGAGMVLMAEPLAAALDSVDAQARHVVFPTPSGFPFRQDDALRLSRLDGMVLICGRYEGIDQRIVDEYVHEELSIGDYVLSSGELAAMVIIDAVYRLREGILRSESVREDSFQDGLLEYPHYTRPETFRSRSVPEVLLSGHHARIARWRREQQLIRTAEKRPELLQHVQLDEAERKLTESIRTKERDDE